MGQITKQIKGKIIFKHKTEADWKLSSYVPDEGEQIIYDPDESHTNPRIKIGDGQKIADDLPFTLDIGLTVVDGKLNITFEEDI